MVLHATTSAATSANDALFLQATDVESNGNAHHGQRRTNQNQEQDHPDNVPFPVRRKRRKVHGTCNATLTDIVIVAREAFVTGACGRAWTSNRTDLACARDDHAHGCWKDHSRTSNERQGELALFFKLDGLHQHTIHIRVCKLADWTRHRTFPRRNHVTITFFTLFHFFFFLLLLLAVVAQKPHQHDDAHHQCHLLVLQTSKTKVKQKKRKKQHAHP